MTYLIFDLAILAILALSAFLGYQRGLILTLCGFLAVFVAFIGASVVSNTLAGPLSRSIQPAVETSIRRLLEESIQHTEFTSSAAESGVAALPEEVSMSGVLSAMRESPLFSGFADAIQEAVDSGLVAAASNAARVAADYVAKQAAHTLLFFLSFLLILLLWALLSHALDLAFKLPVLSTMNQWCGACVGLLRGAVLLFILCWLLRGSVLPRDAVRNTVLLRFFCTASPLSLLR